MNDGLSVDRLPSDVIFYATTFSPPRTCCSSASRSPRSGGGVPRTNAMFVIPRSRSVVVVEPISCPLLHAANDDASEVTPSSMSNVERSS